MNNIQAGLIGGGMMGNAHAAVLRRLGFIDVTAIADRDIETAQLAQQMISVPEAEDVDVVHVLTPNKFHDEEKVPFPTFKTGCQEPAIVDSVLKSNDANTWMDVPRSNNQYKGG